MKFEKVAKSRVENEHKVQSLSPLNNLDQGEEKKSYEKYEERLISSLNEESIFNIAITGIYGSGKSSVLNTFKKRYEGNSQWRFIDISLSSFQVSRDILLGDKDSNTIDESRNTLVEKEELTSEQIQLIERSILQQFFYAVPQDKIPLSRFKRITSSTSANKVTALLVIVLLISGLIVFDRVDYVESIYALPIWLPRLALWSFSVCFIMLLYKLLNISFELSEIKLNFHDSEFNIKNEKEKSILNDHLDEILYFFEATGKNVVIIEDLDRFNNNEIFVRFRELNSMINKYCLNRVVFIYAIKDDMFTDTERSKFFDYIIPIIPIVNPTTAYDIVKKDYNNIAKNLNNKFLLNTCLYFSDMRLLKNILNEYQVYFDQLKVLNIDKNKLFAIVVYKNYYPNEFSKLNSNMGEVYDIFYVEKSKIIIDFIKDKERLILELESRKGEVLSESLSSVNELNSVYAYAILRRLGNLQRNNYSNQSVINITVNSKKYNINDISSTEVLKELEKYQNITFEVTNTSFSVRFRFDDIEKEINTERSYLERLANIDNKLNGYLKQLSDEEVDIRNKIQNIKRQKLTEVLEYSDIIIDKPLLRYFIKNGFIDENYQSYISYFFEESISLNDKNYALLVNSFGEPNFDIELKKCDELVENYLGLDKLSTHSALNFTMLDFLLAENSKKIYLEQ
ncbi:YobI family P-loop NTPase, partial [Psychrobacter sp. AOP7-D1-15]|uniref:YobI family P-loop NTPase n=3 Tax=unclassified Psychrobacter TaxID=196806 RepID=UPI00402BC3AA